MSKLSHIDNQGRAAMVDVSAKEPTERSASAEAVIVLSGEAYDLAVSGQAKKGDVFATARIAGIMAAKNTAQMIPLCHPLALSHVGIAFESLPERRAFRIVASAKTMGPTGVEMEALTAASVAALTVYDMVKAVDKSAVIESVRLLSKAGGKSGAYDAEHTAHRREMATHETVGRETSARETRKPQPRVLVHEVSAPKLPATNERDALRAFMAERRLRATEWAKSAGLPVNELYGYLSGRSRALHPDTAERLAKAARTTVEHMFGRKGSR